MSAKHRFILYISMGVIGLQLTPISGLAHHATAAQFDTSKTVEVKGVISKLDWANPHAHIFVDVKGTRTTDEHWDVELGSPGAIIVSGLSKDLLKPGTMLTITGYPAKSNGSTHLVVCAKQVTLADGTTASFVVGI